MHSRLLPCRMLRNQPLPCAAELGPLAAQLRHLLQPHLPEASLPLHVHSHKPDSYPSPLSPCVTILTI